VSSEETRRTDPTDFSDEVRAFYERHPCPAASAVVPRLIVLRAMGKQRMFLGLLGAGVVLPEDAITWFLGFPLLPRYVL